MYISSGIFYRHVCGLHHRGHFHIEHRKILSMGVFILLAVLCCAARAAEPLTMFKAVLMQPDYMYRERVVSTDALASYIKTVETVGRTAIENSGQQTETAGFIVVALRPSQRSNVWLDFDPAVADAVNSALIAKIRSILPPKIKDGPIVFALKVGLWGGKEPSRTLPNPAEWKAVQQKSLMPLETDELVEKVWKD
ncbi:MAG: hypothetical protein ACXWJK_02050 [Burkholderiaceae bacterium]